MRLPSSQIMMGLLGGFSAMHHPITGASAKSLTSCSTPKKPATKSASRRPSGQPASFTGALASPAGKLPRATPVRKPFSTGTAQSLLSLSST